MSDGSVLSRASNAAQPLDFSKHNLEALLNEDADERGAWFYPVV